MYMTQTGKKRRDEWIVPHTDGASPRTWHILTQTHRAELSNQHKRSHGRQCSKNMTHNMKRKHTDDSHSSAKLQKSY